MANRTLRGSLNIHGTNPQFLVEKPIRSRIYDSRYWKEHCFALTAESIIDPAVSLPYVGGTYGLQRPSPFLCLLLKLLQLQPERDIVLEYLHASEFKYLRALAAMYIRLTFASLEVYELLEPLLNDYRKLRWRDMSGNYSLTYMDSFVDSLLTEERVCDLILPRLTRRDVLEETEGLAPRASKLEEVLLHGAAGLDAPAAGSGSDAESDDSAAEARRDRKRRIERAARIRQLRNEEDLAAAAALRPTGQPGVEGQEEEGQEQYASQELSDEDERRERFVSRSPSRSVSPDRAAPPAEGWRSRSVSRSPGRGASDDDEGPGAGDGYVSRSPSRSPDRD